MEEPKIDELQKIEEARRTRLLLENQLLDRQQIIISRLVADYRADKLVHDKLVGGVAEIAGMQEQIDKLTRHIRGA